MSQGRYVDSNKLSPEKAKLGQHIVQSGYSTFLFSALSRKDWTDAIQKVFALHIYFSVFSGMILFKTGLYFYDFMHARNKNLGKVMSTLRELACAVLILITVVGGFLGSTAIAAISPLLFVATMLINISYNLSISIHNAYRYFTIQDEKSREYYKQSCKKHMIGVFFGSLVTVAMSMIMIFKVAVVAMSIFSACLAGYGFIKGVYTATQLYRKQNESQGENNAENVDFHYKVLDETSHASKKYVHQKAHVVMQETNYYFYRKDRVKHLVECSNNGMYLIEEINAKILSLRREIVRDGDKFFSEKTKRLTKIAVLHKLKNLLRDPTKTQIDFYDLMQSPEFNQFFDNPFQSFFRQKSDTQDIFEAAEKYYKSYSSNIFDQNINDGRFVSLRS